MPDVIVSPPSPITVLREDLNIYVTLAGGGGGAGPPGLPGEPGKPGEPGESAPYPPAVSAEAPGLAPALDNTVTHFLDGTGLWSKPVPPPGSFNGIITTSGTYGIDLGAVAPYTITALLLQTTGGVCVATLTINGIPVEGADSLPITTALVNVSLNTTVAAGDWVGLTIANLGSNQELIYSLHYQM